MALSRITAGLFVGGSRFGEEELKKNSITHVVVLSGKSKGGAKYLVAHFSDKKEAADLKVELPKILEFVKQAEAEKGIVLCHCAQGVSRSPAVVLAIMLHRGIRLREGLHVLKRSRAGARPSDSFMRSLIEIEQQLFGETTVSVEELDTTFWRRIQAEHLN